LQITIRAPGKIVITYKIFFSDGARGCVRDGSGYRPVAKALCSMSVQPGPQATPIFINQLKTHPIINTYIYVITSLQSLSQRDAEGT